MAFYKICTKSYAHIYCQRCLSCCKWIVLAVFFFLHGAVGIRVRQTGCLRLVLSANILYMTNSLLLTPPPSHRPWQEPHQQIPQGHGPHSWQEPQLGGAPGRFWSLGSTCGWSLGSILCRVVPSTKQINCEPNEILNRCQCAGAFVKQRSHDLYVLTLFFK